MKLKYLNCFIALIAGMLVLLFSCKDGPIRTGYKPVLPRLPPDWEELLGEPNWRLEWISEDGIWKEHEARPGSKMPELSLIQEWTTPVLAWPYWPELHLPKGVMRPSGALFPWDVSGAKLYLTWKGAIDAVFWKELASAERSTSAALGRLPWYFDWPRFRELMESENIAEAVREDPWLADWNDIGSRTVQSGFDRRRIVSRAFTDLAIPGIGGLWIGSSPFAPPVDADPAGPLLLNVSGVPDTWVSDAGILKCSTAGWVLQAAR